MPPGAGAGNGIVRPGVRFLLAAVGILAASAPVSIAVTVALFPFWRWLEENFHGESVGHSGKEGKGMGQMRTGHSTETVAACDRRRSLAREATCGGPLWETGNPSSG
mgnify:CR=1 FL=1